MDTSPCLVICTTSPSSNEVEGELFLKSGSAGRFVFDFISWSLLGFLEISKRRRRFMRERESREFTEG